jgi:Tol biopolymer transport system component
VDQSRREGFHAYPSFLPDEHHFVYLRNGTGAGVYAGSLDVPPPQQSTKRIVETNFLPTYMPPIDTKTGWLLFVREDALMAQRFDAGRLELEGDSVALVDHILTFRTEGYSSASANGVLVYRTRATQGKQNLAWFDRKGTDLGRVGDPGVSRGIALSPDGTRVAIGHTPLDTRRWGIFLLDLARNTSMQLTTPSFIADSPVWSPDGGRVVFAITRNGLRNLYEKAANGVGGETPVLESGPMKYANDWSRDGKFLLYTEIDEKTKADLWYLPLSGDRKPVPYLRTEATESQGQFSPDGRWVAYTSDESGRQEVYVQPFPLSAGNGLKSKVSIAGGAQPRWRRDGRELFYLAADRKLMAVEMSTGVQVRPLSTQALFPAPVVLISNDTQRYDVTADGKRFLINTEAAEIAPSPITVVLNWTAGLRE